MFGAPSPRFDCCSRSVSAFWVTDRLPELRMTMTRSAGRSYTVILRKLETWSTPALVRESDANTMPPSSRTPTQYVMPRLGSGAKAAILRDRAPLRRSLVGGNEEVLVDLEVERADLVDELHEVFVEADFEDAVGLAVVELGVDLAGEPLGLELVLVAERLEDLVDRVHARVQAARDVVAQ